jgi:hypothetical protein
VKSLYNPTNAREGYRQPDRQQHRVYSAEYTLDQTSYVRRYSHLDGVVRYLNRVVLPSQWWSRNAPRWHTEAGGTVWVSGAFRDKRFRRAGAASGNVGDDRNDTDLYLYLPGSWAWTDACVLHELAHILTEEGTYEVQCHGYTYAGMRLAMQRRFGLRGSATELHRLYDEFGVEHNKIPR